MQAYGASLDTSDSTVDSHIAHIRNKLREMHSHVEIKSVYVLGYKLEAIG